MKGKLLAGAVVVLFIVMGSFVVLAPESASPDDDGALSPPVELPRIDPRIVVLEDAPFQSEFGKEGTSPVRELELVQLAFRDYLDFVKSGYRRPIGDNRDFVELMTGENPQQIAPIHPRHPRINGNRELTDSNGVPLVIHPLSETTIEVRSAGPDGVVWTDDDLVNLSAVGRDLLEQTMGSQKAQR